MWVGLLLSSVLLAFLAFVVRFVASSGGCSVVGVALNAKRQKKYYFIILNAEIKLLVLSVIQNEMVK